MATKSKMNISVLSTANAQKHDAVPADGTVYSRRKNFCPFSAPTLEEYLPILGEFRVERLSKVARRLRGLKILEINSSASGGGVAEMLFNSVPFLNSLEIEDEWKIIHGNEKYFGTTKRLHNLLQGMEGSFTGEMEHIYLDNLEQCANGNLIDYAPDLVLIHDPQPMALARYLKRSDQAWLWRCHLDIEGTMQTADIDLLRVIAEWSNHYDAAIFSAAHFVTPNWSLPKFIIPPFIDPLSEKNRELSQKEIESVLTKYRIDASIPMIVQIGRFDPWKGLDRTIATYRQLIKMRECRLVLAGGLANDDPEGIRILDQVLEMTRHDENIHVINLSLENRLENYREVNALQRAASVIMQPSTREGFGLVITEALWKGKPVIAGNTGAIRLQVTNGHNAYFYENPKKTAETIDFLLSNPELSAEIGQRGSNHVKEHFLMPDRIADYLMAVEMILGSAADKTRWPESIISFHPWYKLDNNR